MGEHTSAYAVQNLARMARTRRLRLASEPMWVLGLVVLVGEIDKNIVRGLIDPLKGHFGVGDLAIGILLSAQLLFNGVVTVPAGYLADRWNRTRAIGTTVIAWSATTASVRSVGSAAAPWRRPMAAPVTDDGRGGWSYRRGVEWGHADDGTPEMPARRARRRPACRNVGHRTPAALTRCSWCDSRLNQRACHGGQCSSACLS